MSAHQKDEEFRRFSLSAHPLRLLITVCGPLAIYQAFQQIFTILDTIMAAHVSADAVSAIAVLAQITLMIQAVGTGLAVGGCIKISEAYGQGDYKLVQQRTSTLYAMAVLVSVLLAVTIIPFAKPFLRLLNTPEDLITVGAGYFRLQMLNLIVSFFNTVFIAVERSRGHSRRIMFLNLAVITVKLSLSGLFVYILKSGVIMIAVATLCSQLVLLTYALSHMPTDEGAFRFTPAAVQFKSRILLPIFQLSFPVTAEKMLFAAGKVTVNSMAGVYGKLTAGALGVSNNIGGLTTNWHSGMLDGASSVISQNRGAGKYRRTERLFYWLLFIDVMIGLIGLIAVNFTLPYLAQIFASSREQFDQAFCDMIVSIHRWEMFGYITLGVNSACNALMLGYGYAKRTMLLNMARVFVFRIPVLWYLQNYTQMGAEAVGVTMMVSNIATGICSALVVIPVIREIRRMSEKYEAAESAGVQYFE